MDASRDCQNCGISGLVRRARLRVARPLGSASSSEPALDRESVAPLRLVESPPSSSSVQSASSCSVMAAALAEVALLFPRDLPLPPPRRVEERKLSPAVAASLRLLLRFEPCVDIVTASVWVCLLRVAPSIASASAAACGRRRRRRRKRKRKSTHLSHPIKGVEMQTMMSRHKCVP